MNKNPESKPCVSVIIPTFNRSDLLERCVSSFYQTVRNVRHEIIVVDDGSTPEEKAEFGRLASAFGFRILEMPFRQSFARAVNAALRMANGKYILLLNNDVEFQQADWLNRLLRTAEKSWNIGIVGCRLLYPDGTIQHAGGALEDERYDHLFRGERGDFPKACLVYDVAAVTAALMLIKREVLDEIGLLSEDYPLSYEDVDYCLRARQQGWRVVYCGKAVAIHAEGSTRGKSRGEKPDEWYGQEVQSHITFWNRWRNHSSVRPLRDLTCLFALNQKQAMPSERKLLRLMDGLREHGCHVILEKIGNSSRPRSRQQLLERLREVGDGVIFTNDPDLCVFMEENGTSILPVVFIRRSRWYAHPVPQDVHEWINIASQYLKQSK